MLKLTIKRELDNGDYEINFNSDGKDLGNQEKSYEWLRENVVTNSHAVEFIFEVDVKFDHIEIDEEDGEGFVYIITTLGTEDGLKVIDEEQKCYKSYKRAVTAGTKIAQKMDTIVNVLQ